MSFTITNNGIRYTDSAVSNGIVYLGSDMLNFDKYFPIIVSGKRYGMFREQQPDSTHMIKITFANAFFSFPAIANDLTYFINCNESEIEKVKCVLNYQGKYDWFSDGYNFWSNIQIPLFNLSRNDLNKFEFMLPANHFLIDKKVSIEQVKN